MSFLILCPCANSSSCSLVHSPFAKVVLIMSCTFLSPSARSFGSFDCARSKHATIDDSLLGTIVVPTGGCGSAVRPLLTCWAVRLVRVVRVGRVGRGARVARLVTPDSFFKVSNVLLPTDLFARLNCIVV